MREQLIRSDSIEEIQEILGGIEDINAPRDDFDNEPPLVWAASNGHSNIVATLLQHPRINPNIQTELDYTALILAAGFGYDKIVTALLKHPQINPNIQTGFGCTALILAAMKGHKQIVSLIKDHLKSTATIEQAANGLSIAKKSATEGTLSPDANRNAFFSSVPDDIYIQIAKDTRTADTHSDRQVHQIATASYRSISQQALFSHPPQRPQAQRPPEQHQDEIPNNNSESWCLIL